MSWVEKIDKLSSARRGGESVRHSRVSGMISRSSLEVNGRGSMLSQDVISSILLRFPSSFFVFQATQISVS